MRQNGGPHDIKRAGHSVRAVALGIVSSACLVAIADSAWARNWNAVRASDVPAAPALRIYVVNEAGATDDSLAAASREARAIWAEAGLRLVWGDRAPSPDPAFDPSNGRSVTVIVRRALLPNATANPESASNTGRPLAWVRFAEGRPTNLIEVSLSAVTSLVMKGSSMGRPIVGMPWFWQQPFIGRALGRVVAHEIGHWLGGPAHTSDGLMKPCLHDGDLVDRPAPALPRAWIDGGAAELLGGSLRYAQASPAALR